QNRPRSQSSPSFPGNFRQRKRRRIRKGLRPHMKCRQDQHQNKPSHHKWIENFGKPRSLLDIISDSCPGGKQKQKPKEFRRYPADQIFSTETADLSQQKTAGKDQEGKINDNHQEPPCFSDIMLHIFINPGVSDQQKEPACQQKKSQGHTRQSILSRLTYPTRQKQKPCAKKRQDHLPEKLPLRNTIIVREHLSLLSGACALSDVFWQKPGGGSADGKAAVPDRRLDPGNPPGLFPQTASDTEFQNW